MDGGSIKKVLAEIRYSYSLGLLTSDLIQKPVKISRAHLHEFNHQKAFYRILANLCHDIRDEKKN